ncbi:unnamed protein product [Mytilus edulis]|uniref:B box-type domain-containing protein n=1 Tax=Mytilus edulis TaxID=6550 RepID=A0A8S3UBA5_MYTED|nr:unnamed protein product [Mytilus edulis]
MLESNSSESNIFCAVKHLDAMHVSSEKQVNEINKDFATLSVHTLHPEVINYIDRFFQELNDKTKFKTEPVITGSTNDCKKSQIKVERALQSPPPRFQELMAGDESTFESFCFTEDNRIVVLESIRSRNQYREEIDTCLKIFDLQTNKSTEIKLSKPKDKLNLEIVAQFALKGENTINISLVMANVDLCQGCLRENEEEVADQWCNDCNEAVCRNCGHDQLICHECLSNNHRICNKILKIEEAAEGIKDSAAIKELKEGMTTFTNILEKTQIENEQQKSEIRTEKENAKDHINEFLE